MPANVTRAASSAEITELLRKWTGGDSSALEKMLPIV